MGVRFLLFAASLALALALASGAWGSHHNARVPPGEVPNPCLGSEARKLRCPDLQIRRPYDLTVEHTRGGHTLLRATTAIKSRGRGPVEFHGKRIGPRAMRVTQRIYRVKRKPLDIRTKGRLNFFFIPGQGRYWKFTDAARFQLWSLDRDGHLKRVVRTGPKQHYCFRDLVRTSASRRSPGHRIYPGCSQDPGRRRVTLGTSVGWSDIYPADYHEQYVNVSGLRGCYAFYMEADPKNHLRESNESDNRSRVLVRLPSGHVGC
jgi:hypothetical protein